MLSYWWDGKKKENQVTLGSCNYLQVCTYTGFKLSLGKSVPLGRNVEV